VRYCGGVSTREYEEVEEVRPSIFQSKDDPEIGFPFPAQRDPEK
jgi:hypothetical protein